MSTSVDNTSPQRILLVEDDDGTRNSLDLILRRTGFLCRPARDGEEALALLKTGECDVIVTDQALPGMSGVEWLRAARNEGVSTPAIILTGGSGEKPSGLAAVLGITHVLVKPVAPQDLFATLREAIRGGSLASQAA